VTSAVPTSGISVLLTVACNSLTDRYWVLSGVWFQNTACRTYRLRAEASAINDGTETETVTEVSGGCTPD
jgi:hypothetical protein